MTPVLTPAEIRRAAARTPPLGNAKSTERHAKCIFPSNYIIRREMEMHISLLNLPK